MLEHVRRQLHRYMQVHHHRGQNARQQLRGPKQVFLDEDAETVLGVRVQGYLQLDGGESREAQGTLDCRQSSRHLSVELNGELQNPSQRTNTK